MLQAQGEATKLSSRPGAAELISAQASAREAWGVSQTLDHAGRGVEDSDDMCQTYRFYCNCHFYDCGKKGCSTLNSKLHMWLYMTVTEHCPGLITTAKYDAALYFCPIRDCSLSHSSLLSRAVPGLRTETQALSQKS